MMKRKIIKGKASSAWSQFVINCWKTAKSKRWSASQVWKCATVPMLSRAVMIFWSQKNKDLTLDRCQTLVTNALRLSEKLCTLLSWWHFRGFIFSLFLLLFSHCQLFSKSEWPMPRLIPSYSLFFSQRQFKGICVRLVPIRSSSLFSRHWQPAIWDPLGLITPPLDSLTMHPLLLLLSSAVFSFPP